MNRLLIGLGIVSVFGGGILVGAHAVWTITVGLLVAIVGTILNVAGAEY